VGIPTKELSFTSDSKHYQMSPRKKEAGFTLINGGLKIKNVCFVQGYNI
jgi:hypothetical protein